MPSCHFTFVRLCKEEFEELTIEDRIQYNVDAFRKGRDQTLTNRKRLDSHREVRKRGALIVFFASLGDPDKGGFKPVTRK